MPRINKYYTLIEIRVILYIHMNVENHSCRVVSFPRSWPCQLSITQCEVLDPRCEVLDPQCEVLVQLLVPHCEVPAQLLVPQCEVLA